MPEPLSPGDQGDEQQQDPPAENNAAGGGNTNDDELGEAGKKALEAERTSRRAAERRLKELETELAKIRESSMSETEKAIAKAKREALTEAQTAFNRRLVQAEVRATAAGKLADPEDAIRFINLDQFEADSDGNFDKKAIEREIGSLLKAKPYLAASAKRPAGDADQGARGTPGGASMNDLLRRAAGR